MTIKELLYTLLEYDDNTEVQIVTVDGDDYVFHEIEQINVWRDKETDVIGIRIM